MVCAIAARNSPMQSTGEETTLSSLGVPSCDTSLVNKTLPTQYYNKKHCDDTSYGIIILYRHLPLHIWERKGTNNGILYFTGDLMKLVVCCRLGIGVIAVW